MGEKRLRYSVWGSVIGLLIAAWPALRWLGTIIGVPGMIDDFGTWGRWLASVPWGTVLPPILGLSIVAWANWPPIKAGVARLMGREQEAPEEAISDTTESRLSAKAAELSNRVFQFMNSNQCDFSSQWNAQDTKTRFEVALWVELVHFRGELHALGFSVDFLKTITPTIESFSDIRTIAIQLAEAASDLRRWKNASAIKQ